MNKKSYKIILALLASGILLSGVFFVINKKELKLSNTVVVKNQNSKTEPKLEIDSDEDGLQDWEETLWSTDAKNKDTDGDGTEDGTEVKAGRNPSVAGPNDSLNSTSSNTGGSATATAKENVALTPTEKLGREMFAQYLSLKQSGITFDEQTTNTFASELIKKTATDIDYKVYIEKDLQLALTDNPATIKVYGNALSEGIRINSSETESEFLIFSRFVESEDKTELLKLSPIIVSYRGMLNSMLAIPIPKSAVEAHLQFVNALSLTLASLENMSTAEPDPFIGVITIERHMSAAQELQDSLNKLGSYFIAQNIDFTQ